MNFWVDMDNAPHVQILRPIIADLKRKGHQVEVTARDYGQTLPLLRMYGLTARRIGRHGGGNTIGKILSLASRSLHLCLFGMGKRFDAVLCHGSRSVFPAARFLGLPLINMDDYEHASLPRFMVRWTHRLLAPAVIPPEAIAKGLPLARVCGYPGLKEDLYVHDFEPDPAFLDELGLDPSRVLVLVRPPANMAHYAVAQSDIVFHQALEYLCGLSNVEILLIPRTAQQGNELRTLARRKRYGNLFFPGRVYDGPSLVWFSDLVVSGGGTMNREAATLGVPVYSIYQGPIGAVDRYLIETGKLVHVRDVDELRMIPFVKRERKLADRSRETGQRVRDFVVDQIIEAVGMSRS